MLRGRRELPPGEGGVVRRGLSDRLALAPCSSRRTSLQLILVPAAYRLGCSFFGGLGFSLLSFRRPSLFDLILLFVKLN